MDVGHRGSQNVKGGREKLECKWVWYDGAMGGMLESASASTNVDVKLLTGLADTACQGWVLGGSS